jgi:glycosyltransferase involved in cell wall biosynthesis
VNQSHLENGRVQISLGCYPLPNLASVLMEINPLAERMSQHQVRIIPAWKTPIIYLELERHPPDGYQFTITSPQKGVVHRIARFGFSYTVQGMIGKFVPLQILLGQYRGIRAPKTDMLYSVTHINSYRNAWILDMMTELPSLLAGSERQSAIMRGYMRNILLTPNCKGVICWVKAGASAFVDFLGTEMSDKVHVVYWGKNSRKREPKVEKRRLTLLFINSANINTEKHFFEKGGMSVVYSFLKLKPKYPNLNLIIRSGMPSRLHGQLNNIPGIRATNTILPANELDRIWSDADIFVLPNFVNTPASALLDAMSYGLPIVTTDIWANPELVEEGKSGFLVHPQMADKYVVGNTMHMESIDFLKAIYSKDEKFTDSLADAISTLVEDESLRRRMGEYNYRLVVNGKFSVKERNSRLKRVLDAAFS